jgi:hypothetical protein
VSLPTLCVELTSYFTDIGASSGLDAYRQLTSGWLASSPQAPSRWNFGRGSLLGSVRSMSSRLDDSFCEGLARDLLERDGPEVVSRLRLEAIEARREGHRRGAELLSQIADAAERLLRQTGQSN